MNPILVAILNWLQWRFPDPTPSEAAFLQRTLLWLTKLVPANPPAQAVRFTYSVSEPEAGLVITQERMLMPNVLKPHQKVTITIGSPVDVDGNPAQIDGLPAWASSDPSVLELTDISADGLSAVAHHRSKGTAQVVISGDADLGPDQKTITTPVDFECLAAEAVGFSVTVGSPEDDAA